MLLRQLQRDYAITGAVTDWIAPYLRGRARSLNINSTSLDKIRLKYGFPQGSKIGPFGFRLYTKALAAIAKKYIQNSEIDMLRMEARIKSSVVNN